MKTQYTYSDRNNKTQTFNISEIEYIDEDLKWIEVINTEGDKIQVKCSNDGCDGIFTYEYYDILEFIKEQQKEFDIPSRFYSDWFGNGDLGYNVEHEISCHGNPLNIFYEKDGYMAALVYEDRVICVGYDGEYCHRFDINEKLKKKQ